MGPHSSPLEEGYLMSMAHRAAFLQPAHAMCMRALSSIQLCHALGCSIAPLGPQSSAGKGVWGPTPRDGVREGGDMGLCHLQSSAPPHPYHCPPPHSVQSCLQQLALLYCGGCNTDVSSKACSSVSPSLGIIQPPIQGPYSHCIQQCELNVWPRPHPHPWRP